MVKGLVESEVLSTWWISVDITLNVAAENQKDLLELKFCTNVQQTCLESHCWGQCGPGWLAESPGGGAASSHDTGHTGHSDPQCQPAPPPAVWPCWEAVSGHSCGWHKHQWTPAPWPGWPAHTQTRHSRLPRMWCLPPPPGLCLSWHRLWETNNKCLSR